MRLRIMSASGRNAAERGGSQPARQRRFSEAVPELQRAASLAPLAASPRVAAGLEYSMARDYDEALRHFSEARNPRTCSS
jgi:Flp pilus assembly protein TadD